MNGKDRRRLSSGGTARRAAPRACASVASSSRARAAGLGRDRCRPLPWAALVRRFELVRRFLFAVHLREKLLHVTIEPAFTHLVSLDLDEGVVAAFRPGRKTHRSQWTRKGARARRGHQLRDAYRRKELIRGLEDLSRRKVTAVEMSHRR